MTRGEATVFEVMWLETGNYFIAISRAEAIAENDQYMLWMHTLVANRNYYTISTVLETAAKL